MIHHADCLDLLPTLEVGSVDAVVTDPPYGLKFMGKTWDHGLPDPRVWAECLRVLRPGGYLMAFGGTRTYHRLTCSIEDAGFEIRDCLMWLYGSGYPKSKGCLKPAWEPIVLARKPGKKVLPLGIEETRVAGPAWTFTHGPKTGRTGGGIMGEPAPREGVDESNPAGRWPPNLILNHHPDCDTECHAECVVRTLGEQSGELRAGERPKNRSGLGYHGAKGVVSESRVVLDTGTAARFYPRFRYCPKASRKDRNEGCEGNTHPTVKPTDLMEWLVRLACPEGGTVLDPFCGSGSTGKACVRAGRRFIGVERDEEWLPVARARIEHERAKAPLFAG